jgi:cytochrome c-type biogenesis protein CcmH/NrfF
MVDFTYIVSTRIYRLHDYQVTAMYMSLTSSTYCLRCADQEVADALAGVTRGLRCTTSGAGENRVLPRPLR